ncbi:MAG: RecQ family ATP-dependent DNA helicase [Pseudoclavibacter sp.]|nr:RecQ family ATP-dependent DNA helicase [Pseudoclavibacter sp.]
MREPMAQEPSADGHDGTIAERALEILRRLSGRADAEFRPGQLEAILALVEERRRTLVVQRTGWGKSAVYFIASLLLRERGSGPTLLVSPLLALMRDQIAAAERAGVRAATLNSANQHEWREISQRLADDEVDVLLVSPERLNNPGFREEHLPRLTSSTGLVVVDEAHCISDWGHDFRPDYRRIARLVAGLPEGLPVLATTATANERVVRDVEEQLAGPAGAPHGVLTLRGSLARDSLRLGVLRLADAQERLAWLVTHLRELPGSGIVYALTVAAADDTARMLREAGYEVDSYTGKADPEARERMEARLKENRCKALVATSALGMGFDKPDLGFIVHLGAPSSPVAYYQQIGRAGRGSEDARVLLLPGAEDAEIWRYFATASMPVEETARQVIAALGPEPVSTPELETRVELRRTRLELLLKVLDVEGAVARVRGGWVTTGRPWRYDAERYARIARAREQEQRAMLRYQEGGECRMAFLQRELDDPSARPCGRCDECAGPWYPVGADDAAREAVGGALRRAGVVIEPRLRWPTGMAWLGVETGRAGIPAEERCQEGRAVARLTDLGWGGPLRRLFRGGDGTVPPGMVEACVRVLSEWGWQRRPALVASVPSRSRPRLVASLAAEIARIGRLPDAGPLRLRAPGPQRGHGGNSAHRLAGVWNAFEVPEPMRELLPAGPVLLVDDRADSRWTLAVAGRALRRAGAPAVLPLVLALEA